MALPLPPPLLLLLLLLSLLRPASPAPCSPLDASCAPEAPVGQPPCIGPYVDFALDDPCADPRMRHLPYTPLEPPKDLPPYRAPPPGLPLLRGGSGAEAAAGPARR